MSTNQTARLEPLRLSPTDLQNIMNMCEASIKAAEFAHHLFGLDEVVQARSVASDLQARCERELARQAIMEQQRQSAENSKLEEKKRKEAEELKKKSEEVNTDLIPSPEKAPEPVEA